MSLTSIINAGMTGLMAAQTQLRVVSDNISNVSTPGYIRKVANQTPVVMPGGQGAGVEVSSIKLSTDIYLQAASLNAGANASAAGARYDLLDRMQSLFGDPSTATGFFSQVDKIFAAFAPLSENATSSPLRSDAITQAASFLDQSSQVYSGIQAVRGDADGQIANDVEKVNSLLKDIENLNVEISRSTVVGSDASGAEGAQSQLIDQLSKLIDIKVSGRSAGGVTIRTGDGTMLAGDGAATLSYDRAGTINGQTNFNQIWLTQPGGTKVSLADHITSGEIKGLMQLRDVDAPATAARLAELTSQVADQLNRAHNANSAAPAPASLTGKNTGLDLPTAVSGFTGKTTVGITDANGVLQKKVDIDFTAGTMSVNGGAPTAFTPATFLSSLNGALGGAGTASFSNGALTLSASGGAGVAIADDATTPSANRTGRSFSDFFGMNDLIRSSQVSTYDTGLTGTDPNGFTPGQTMTFRFTAPNGSQLKDITVAVPPGGTMDDLINALNSSSTGVGRFGAFSMDAKGQMSFTSSLSPAPSMSVVNDQTSRGPGGPSFTQLFGVGGSRTDRTASFSIRADIDADTTKLALAQFDPTAAVGSPALSKGDGRGSRALSDAGQKMTAFDAAGGSVAQQTSVSRYAADLSGGIGQAAASAKANMTASNNLQQEADSRRSAYEGVNLDEELTNLTTYQQAYNASSRLIQAAKDMYDVLIGMMG